MKFINRDTDYAVRALSYIASCKNKIVTTSELVKELHIPQPFLRKILQILNKNRILSSSKGRGGGFILAQHADKILLADLIRVFQGPLKLNKCIFKKRICPDKSVCMLKQKIGAIERNVISELESISIASLL